MAERTRKKHPHKWNLEEISKLADKYFPPIWSVHEAIVRLASFVDKCQNPPHTVPKGAGDKRGAGEGA